MDRNCLDWLAQTVAVVSPRRTVFGLGLGLASVLGRLGLDDADAKKRKKKCKKKCGPCQKCKKGKCKPKKAGTPCGEGKQCFANGTCVACDVCHGGCDFISLQAAVAAAGDGAMIQLCPGTYPTNADIGKDVTIVGAGSGESGTVLDGQGLGGVIETGVAGRLLEIEIRSLTITGGVSEVGAGIYAIDKVTLEDVHLTDNHATGGGGAIYSFVETNLINTRITGNSAGAGGGIRNNGSLILTAQSVVTGNTGYTLGGPDAYTAGGIDNTGGTVQILDGSSVTDNTPFDCAGTEAC